MKQVKIFFELDSTCYSVNELEEKVNRWLETEKNNINIIKIDFQTSRNSMYVFIFYKDKSLPVY